MTISSVNSVSFGGFFSDFRAKKAVKYAQKLAERAEKKLLSRLVSIDKLMIDTSTGLVLDAKTGNVFSGKFIVPTDKIERIYKIKDGTTVASLVRMCNGVKYWANYIKNGISSSKNFPVQLPIEMQKMRILEMRFADDKAFDCMTSHFGAKAVVRA